MQPLNLTETLEDQLQNRVYADQIGCVTREDLEMYQRAIASLMKGGISG